MTRQMELFTEETKLEPKAAPKQRSDDTDRVFMETVRRIQAEVYGEAFVENQEEFLRLYAETYKNI